MDGIGGGAVWMREKSQNEDYQHFLHKLATPPTYFTKACILTILFEEVGSNLGGETN